MEVLGRFQKTILVLSIVAFSAWVFVDHRIAWQWIYTHWLFDYHFGFMRRGFIGELLALSSGPGEIVPLEIVKAISWLILGANFGLFGSFFWRLLKSSSGSQLTYGILFFCFFLLSPVGLRNFAYDLGRFDQISFLLLLAQWFNPPLLVTALGATLMVLVHENFIFILLPAILLLVYGQKGVRGAILVLACSALATLTVVLAGKPGAPIDQLWAYIQSKANAPLDENVRLLYWNLHDQLEVNKSIYAGNLRYLLGYIFCFLWCVPLVALYRKIAPKEAVGRLLWLGIFAGYCGILMLSDWGRSISDFFVVLSFLILYFAKTSTDFKQRLLTPPSWLSKTLVVGLVVSLIVPAGGVDIPRIYKFKELIVRYIHSTR